LHSELIAKHVCAGSYVKADFHNSLEAKIYKENKNKHNDLLCIIINITR